MSHSHTKLILIMALSVLSAAAGIVGTFQGEVVEGGREEGRSYLYVRAQAGSMRRVDIEKARVRYDATVPNVLRGKTPVESLRNGVEVRVTAEQGGQGEWTATDILILRVPRPAKTSAIHSQDSR